MQGGVEEDHGHLLRVRDVQRERVETGGGEGLGGPVDLHGAEPTRRPAEDQRLSRWNLRTASGRNTDVITAGHTSAIIRACSSTQVPPLATGLPNSCRAAVTVEETGFQAASVPSRPGR